MNELDKLEAYLKDKGIEYKRIDRREYIPPFYPDDELFKGYGERHQIIVYEHGWRSWDAICHCGSYGYEQGLLEIYGSIVESGDVIGYLTADDVIKMIEEESK